MRKYTGKVIIATHFYKHQASMEYVNSMMTTCLAMERLGISFDYWLVSGHFHMETCVNGTLSKFLESDGTDIIIIDSDESWNPEHLIRLLTHEEDIVCGVYRQTNPKEKTYPVIINTAEDGSQLGKLLPDGNCLLEAERIPAGFLKISKFALQQWVKQNPDEWFWLEGEKTYKFFVNEFKDNVFHGMDFCFADKMRSLGFQIWVDPIIDITHWGVYPYKGTYDSYLRTLKTNQDAQGSFDIIRQMAKEIEERNV